MTEMNSPHRSLRQMSLLCLALLFPALASAQIDPKHRQLLQLGYDRPLEGNGPLDGYFFYYWNRPRFVRKDLTLRMAVAPLYVDSDLGFKHLFGPQTDVSFGLAGGGFADTYTEIRKGMQIDDESFTGHGGEFSMTVSHLFDPGKLIPLYANLKAIAHYSAYKRSRIPEFIVPDNRLTYTVRSGLRFAGREPVIFPSQGMEISVWHELQVRGKYGPYGFNGDREVKAATNNFWARAMLAYTLPKIRHAFEVSLTAGEALNADRFSAFRLGSALPLRDEFPLNIPGYFYQEITARRFILGEGQYTVPLNRSADWGFTLFGNSAAADYLPGMEQPGHLNSGVGGGITYRSKQRIWTVIATYAYGIDAIRNGGRGSHSVGILVQYDLFRQERYEPNLSPYKSGGFNRVLNRINIR